MYYRHPDAVYMNSSLRLQVQLSLSFLRLTRRWQQGQPGRGKGAYRKNLVRVVSDCCPRIAHLLDGKALALTLQTLQQCLSRWALCKAYIELQQACTPVQGRS